MEIKKIVTEEDTKDQIVTKNKTGIKKIVNTSDFHKRQGKNNNKHIKNTWLVFEHTVICFITHVIQI